MSLQSPQLNAFMAIVKYKTVHAAASAISLTQTAVTQRLRNLEQQLSTTLFIRSRRGMKLTPEGEALLHYCEAVNDLEGEALARIQGSGELATVRLCITGPTTIMRSRLIPQCLPVMARYSNLLMTFDIDDLDERVHKLRTGQAQLALVQEEFVAKEMESKRLSVEEFVLVSTPEWKKRSLKDILKEERIVDFDEEDEMTFNYLRHFQLSTEPKHDRHFVNDTESMATILQQGFGYGVLPKEFCQSFLDDGSLVALNNGRIYEHAVALAWYPRSQAPKYFLELVEAIV